MTDYTQFRQQKDAYFRSDANSPLTEAQKAAFTGLRYYAPNPDLDLEVTVERFPEDTPTVPIITTTNEIRHYKPYGRFTFEVAGEAATLTIYAAPYGFFLPFVDAGAGSETYPAGRYLDPEQLDADTFHVDFNLAYNPYCAFNARWNCPITPQENRLSVAIRAGEKLPAGPWIDSHTHLGEDAK